jgi:hypothetical protein
MAAEIYRRLQQQLEGMADYRMPPESMTGQMMHLAQKRG